jgi:hypothetical protein
MNYRICGHAHFPIEAATFEGTLYSADRLNSRAVLARLKYTSTTKTLCPSGGESVCETARLSARLRTVS